MKRFIALMLVLSMLVFAGCEKKGENTLAGIYDPNTEIEYALVTPMGLYPVYEGEEYVTVKNEDGTETTYFEVMFEDPAEFICYEANGYYFLARNVDIPEPTVNEFNPIAAAIYDSSNTVYITSFYADNEYLPDEKKEHNPTEDTWLCQMIAEYLTTGENVNVPATAEERTDQYRIRLFSQDYPGLYYLVTFYGYNGRYFLSDGAQNKTVYCPRDIITRMVGE